MTTCLKCKKSLPAAKFNRQAKRCKECVKSQVRSSPKQQAYRREYSRRPITRYNQQKSINVSREISWEITFEEFLVFLSKKCTYCKGPLGETGSSLDRIDTSKGYAIGNVVPCCPVCNYVRVSMFTLEEMKLIGKLIAKIRSARKSNGQEPITCVTSR